MSKEMGEISELRADPSLLNFKFDHYLLANRTLKLTKSALPSEANFSCPTSTQFGYQHATLYSKIERLVLDLFNSTPDQDHLYTFLDNGTLVKLVYKPSASNLISLVEVASINLGQDRQNAFPPSLMFSASDCAIVSNGNGQLVVYNTGDRTCDNKWNPILSYLVFIDAETDTVAIAPSSDSTNVSGLPFLVVDARRTSDTRLSLLLESISDKKRLTNTVHGSEKAPFFTRLIWLDLDLKGLAIVLTRELHYNGHLELATLNHDASEIVTVGATQPTFTYDSKRPIETSDDTMEVDDKSTPVTEVKQPVYVWSQDAEEITVTFALAESIHRNDVVYSLTSQDINVEIKGVTVLEGKLGGTVHLDTSTWVIHDNSLQITLFKARGHYWRELIVGDNHGIYQPDPELIARSLESLQKFSSEKPEISSRDAVQSTFNSEQMEECDNADEDSRYICWTSGDDHKCIETKDASCSQLLFDTRIQPGGPKTIATRQEHDGIVWSLNQDDLVAGKRIAHKYTLDAFGYVQAGHAQKMFSGCCPDGSFSTVIHMNHHAFIYFQNVPIGNDSQLVNRKTKQEYREVKEQLVVNTAGLFDQNDSLNSNFIGFAISNTLLYLLTRGHVVACHVKV